MAQTLKEFIANHKLHNHLLSDMQTHGFVTAMAAAPHLIDPSEWLAFMWGGEETSPFESHELLEEYANIIVAIWNEQREALLSNQWQWPEACALDDEEIVNAETRLFCEGLLQGWTLARDDWETLMPEQSEDNALLGGVILSITLMFDPESALSAMEQQGAAELAQFEEVFNAMPTMLCGLTMRAAQRVEESM
ncbi:UPF0149 family protein [Veronia pacifica]|uniref:YecA family protein n=1 Tax=Veronia pacifica TaxID=1080227 RepID=A0A1C3ERW1_9GAMM|nr:UPF0149 family protein [Veronia pacifica]ODA35966.1 hypothetical protein A8L45_02760 [Veronia pacifica]